MQIKYRFLMGLAAGVTGGWFLYPTVKILRIFLPIMVVAWLIFYMINRYFVQYPIIHEVTVEHHETITNKVTVTERFIRSVTETNFVTVTIPLEVVVKITNYVTNYVAEYVFISPVINSNGDRMVEMDGRVFPATVKRDLNSVTVISKTGILRAKIADIPMMNMNLANIPYVQDERFVVSTNRVEPADVAEAQDSRLVQTSVRQKHRLYLDMNRYKVASRD